MCKKEVLHIFPVWYSRYKLTNTRYSSAGSESDCASEEKKLREGREKREEKQSWVEGGSVHALTCGLRRDGQEQSLEIFWRCAEMVSM